MVNSLFVRLIFTLLNVYLLLFILATSQAHAQSQVVTRQINSTILQNNLIGLDTSRHMTIYLPDGYDTQNKRYPVVYFLHSFFWSDKQMFEDGIVKSMLDKSIANGTIKPFILVAADFGNHQVGSFYENSPVSGRWLDFITQEWVPYVDSEFRTIANKNSRGVTGEMIGGYGALKLAMMFPDIFSSVYALHPVGTGLGYNPMVSRPDWRIIHESKSFEELMAKGNIFSTIFAAMAQAYSPNPNRPPLYADFLVEPVDDEYKINYETAYKLRKAFLLDRQIHQYADNLHQLRGIKFDWGRYDTNQDHVLSNQNFTRLLDEYGIEHSAEEYRGGTFDKNWIANGRIEDNVLPFFNRLLEFE
ncbi:alpha/beta hydrolase [Aliiglaciecola sp. M165]|uniref:alpha/beta hydrolase n=1 Tax=Aliiglaciecola sp. M165 TaxID=2593649 RepID=UPI00117EDD12|nr:alpha/beta hydrolase-fold protein [Aliiglaciecola sp. M165]TRY33994.1 peptide methionine sulfoxide reductase [Aliiglaciecola sp. M165]